MEQIKRNSEIPLYLQLVEIFRRKIESGAIRPGDKLMSETEMVKRYGVARLTVREALNHLVNEGLIEKQHGRGSFCKTSAIRKDIDVLLDMNEHYFIPYYMQSISAVLEAHNANLVAGDTKNSHKEIIRRLEAIAIRGSDGVILQGCPGKDFDKEAFTEAIYKLKEKHIPIIVIDYSYDLNDLCCAAMDEKNVGLIAAKHFVQCGHTKSAAVLFADGFAEKRFSGFCEGINNCIRINTGANLKEELIDAVNNGITGFFCYNDPLAKECMDILQEYGYKVPEDVSVIGVDDTMLAKFSRMTSVAHPKQLLGEYAAKEILLSCTPRSKIFEPVLVERNSVKQLI